MSTEGDDEFTGRLAAVFQDLGGDERVASLLGHHPKTIEKYRRGRSDPKFSDVVRVSNAAGVSVEWLANGEGPRDASPGKDYILWDPDELRELIVLVQEIEETWLHEDEELTPEARAAVIADAYEREMRHREEHERDMPLNAVGRMILELVAKRRKEGALAAGDAPTEKDGD